MYVFTYVCMYVCTHADTMEVLKNPAARAARRRGLTSGRDIYRQAAASIGLALQRRSARMALACLRTIDEENEEQIPN